MSSFDLKIKNDDLVLSSIGEPELVTSAWCVAQDLRHMIRENGYAVELVGERNRVKVAAATKAIELAMEDDDRVYPGTAAVTLDGERLICIAKTIEGERVEVVL